MSHPPDPDRTGPAGADGADGDGADTHWWPKLQDGLIWAGVIFVLVLSAGMFVYDFVHDNMIDGPECTYFHFMTLQCL